MTDKKLKSEPDLYPGVRRGYRAWRDGTYSGRHVLASLSQPDLWHSSSKEAVCLLGGTHQSPDELCSCGIYAKYRLSSLANSSALWIPHIIIGVVDLYGKLIESKLAVRAEKAKIRALIIPNRLNTDPYNHYNVPLFSSHEELLDQFPPDEDIPKDDEPQTTWTINGPITLTVGAGGTGGTYTLNNDRTSIVIYSGGGHSTPITNTASYTSIWLSNMRMKESNFRTFGCG